MNITGIWAEIWTQHFRVHNAGMLAHWTAIFGSRHMKVCLIQFRHSASSWRIKENHKYHKRGKWCSRRDSKWAHPGYRSKSYCVSHSGRSSTQLTIQYSPARKRRTLQDLEMSAAAVATAAAVSSTRHLDYDDCSISTIQPTSITTTFIPNFFINWSENH
jgi:hypothetical protein